MTRIVVGVDGSHASLAALRWADHQAQLSGARLELVHVYSSAPPYVFSPGGGPAFYTVDPARLQAQAQALLREAMSAAGVMSTDVQLTVLDDASATRALGRAAVGAAMLVLGVHHRHGLGVLLGSTATACVRNALCPVVVVPTVVPEPAPEAAPHKLTAAAAAS